MKKIYNQPQTQSVINIETASDLMQIALSSDSMLEPSAPLREFNGDSYSSLKYLI